MPDEDGRQEETQVTTQEGDSLPVDDLINAQQDPGALQEREPEQPPADAGTETPPAEPATEPEPTQVERYTWKGEELTLDELKERGLLEDVFVTAGKYGTLQRRYEELKEKAEREPEPTPEPEPEPPAPLSHQEIMKTWLPEAQAAVQSGHLPAEFVEDWPDVAAELCFNRDRISVNAQRVDALIKRTEYLEGIIGEFVKSGQRQQWQNWLTQKFDAISQRKDPTLPTEFFSTLQNPEVRQRFTQYLVKLKPSRELLESDEADEFLVNQFIAFNRDVLPQVFKDAQRGRTQRETQRRQARGEGANTKPSTPPPAAGNDGRLAIDDMIDDAARSSP